MEKFKMEEFTLEELKQIEKIQDLERERAKKEKEFKESNPNYMDDEEFFTECNCTGKFPW